MGGVAVAAAIGGAVSAVTGGDVLQGALMGGAGGAIGGAISGTLGSGMSISDAVGNIATGVGNAADNVSNLFTGAAANTDLAASQAVQDYMASTGVDQATAVNAMQGTLGMTPAQIDTAIGNVQAAASGGQSLGSIGVPTTGSQSATAANTASSTIGKSILGSLAPTGSQMAGLASNLGSAYMQSQAASDAAKSQQQAAQTAGQQQLAMYDTNVSLQAPWRAAGTQALGQLTAGTQPGGQFNTPFTMSMAQNMPAYQFAEQQGQGAINAHAGAGGTQLSSANLENLAQFNAGNAAQFENQAFNQYQAQNAVPLNALQSLAQVGQTATQQTANLGANAASNVGQATMAAGNASAAGTVGSTAPWANLIGNQVNQGVAQNTLSGLLNSAA